MNQVKSQSMYRILIFSGGNFDRSYLQYIKKGDFLIAVDRASVWLVQNNITADLAIGDFDSVTGNEKRTIQKKIKKIIEYPESKDKTDLELAIEYAINEKVEDVIIFGVWGCRLDHVLSGISLLEKLWLQKIRAKIVDKNNEVIFVSGTHNAKRNKSYKYLSIIPVSEKIIASTKGLKYNLCKDVVGRATSTSISNEVTGKEYEIDIIEGSALVILSRD